MIFGIFSFSSYPPEKKQISKAQKTIFLKNGFLSFFPFENSSVHPFVIATIGIDNQVCIHGVTESEACQQFPSYDTFISHIRISKHFYKKTVIVFDEIKNEALLIRDLFGSTPLYYIHVRNELYAFSSSLTSLISIPEFQNLLQIDSEKIEEYLTWLQDSNPYNNSTFFQNFKKVLPGNQVILSPEKVSSSQFHKLNLSRWTDLISIEEYGNVFKNLFKESVEYSLKYSNLISAQLSGGLDSSSVCCMIHHCQEDLKIHTIYADTETDLTDEASYAQTVSDSISSVHHALRPGENDYESADLHISLYGQPEYMQNSAALNRSMIQLAQATNCSSLFSGHPGDAIVGYGGDYLNYLFNNRSWDDLKAALADPEIQLLNITRSEVDAPIFKIVYSLLAQQKGRIGLYHLLQLIFKTSKVFDIPLSFFIKNGIRKVIDKFRLPSSILVQKQRFKTKTVSPAIDPLDSIDNAANMADPAHFYDLFGVQSMMFAEEIYILDYYYNVANVFPLLDKDLLEMCMVVPSKIKYDNGLRRGHFREAMKNIVPENVRTRRSKGNFGIYGRKATLSLYKQALEILGENEKVWRYVDRPKFKHSLQLLKDNSQKLYVYNKVLFFVSRTIYLAIWLKKIDNKQFTPFIG